MVGLLQFFLLRSASAAPKARTAHLSTHSELTVTAWKGLTVEPRV